MLIGCSLEVAGCRSGLEVVEGRVETVKLWHCDAGREAQGWHRWTAKRRRCCTHADFLLLVEPCWALFGVDYWMALTLGSLWHRAGRGSNLTGPF
jgi:hypothetical protein